MTIIYIRTFELTKVPNTALGLISILCHRPDPRALLLIASRFCIRKLSLALPGKAKRKLNYWTISFTQVFHKTIPRHRPDPRASYPGASCWGARLPASNTVGLNFDFWKGLITRCLFEFKQTVHRTRNSSASSRFKRCSSGRFPRATFQWVLMTSLMTSFQ